MAILAGDIGGTKTLLQLSEPNGKGFDVLFEKRYVSADHVSLTSMTKEFLSEAATQVKCDVAAACFGIAGPVSGRTAKTTNLPWVLNADDMEKDLGITRVRLINDFQSVGYGIEALQPQDMVTLQAGTPVAGGTRVIIGAGTGLGQGLLVWQGKYYEVVASEGGHASFAPSDEVQDELMIYLRQRYHWPTWERAVSGRGLVNIFDFLVETKRGEVTSAMDEALKTEDRAAVISRFGMAGSDPLAAQAMNLFVSLYGAQAGNLALTGLATGGVYVAGGVAPKIIDKLKDGTFMHGFLDKEERMQGLLKAMPVQVVVNANVGLLGSAVAAARLALD
jgi:glucokinase